VTDRKDGHIFAVLRPLNRHFFLSFDLFQRKKAILFKTIPAKPLNDAQIGGLLFK